MQRETAQNRLSELGRWLHQKNYLAAADGNFSLKSEGQEFWITSSGVHKGYSPCSVSKVAFDGTVLSGTPSSETALHCVVYRHCPRAQAVIHAHPPALIAWSIARPDLSELPCESFSEVILALGRIPIVSFARPGGHALSNSVIAYLPGTRAMVLGRHGALSWGESLEEALNGIERMEHAALILSLAHNLGGAKPLPLEDVEWLRARRLEMGETNL